MEDKTGRSAESMKPSVLAYGNGGQYISMYILALSIIQVGLQLTIIFIIDYSVDCLLH